MDFSDGQYLIPYPALSRGPDVFRPGSGNSKHGSGRQAFFYTKYPDKNGEHLHVFSVGEGHEKHISDPDILQGLFGPNLEKMMPEITSMQTIYGPRDPKTGFLSELGQERRYDHWEIRRHAMKDNLIGRLGYIKNIEALMLWGIPQNNGWQMVRDVIDLLHMSDDARICNGTSELGPVWKFKEVFDSSKNPKELKVNQDLERIQALAKYHVATGDEKIAMQKQYGFGKDGGELPYPDTSTMTPTEIAKYPWKRSHWRKKIKELGLYSPFQAGESVSFAAWLAQTEKFDEQTEIN